MQLTPHTGTETQSEAGRSVCGWMQLTPHTGTETQADPYIPYEWDDATHTPHGDGNASLILLIGINIDATHTPHGDGNPCHCRIHSQKGRCNSHPTRGRKHTPLGQVVLIRKDATHTPHGDGNLRHYFCDLL